MQITFTALYQAQEFVYDCKRNGIVTLAWNNTVEFADYKVAEVGQILIDSSKC